MAEQHGSSRYQVVVVECPDLHYKWGGIRSGCELIAGNTPLGMPREV